MSYKYFANKDCQFYPCHPTVTVNCLFCFCPLYPNKDCGGDYSFVQIKGKALKDCSNCTLPHSPNGYDYIIEKLKG